MIGSNLFQDRKLRVLALLMLVLIFVGCAEKAADLDRLIADAKQAGEKGDNKAAVIHLKNLLQKAPEHAEARYLLGATYNTMGDFRAAEPELRRALEMRYDAAKVMPALGKALLMKGDFQKVLDQVKLEGDASDAVQAELLTLRALASLGLGRIDQGRELLAQALAKKPDFAGALLGQARIAARENKLDEGMRLIERALAGTPKGVDAWLLKGDFLRARADPAGAIAAYQKVLELRPENLAARLNIASLNIDGGKYDDALKQIEQVRKIAPGSVIATYMQALIEFRKKDLAAARETVLKVLKAAPTHIPSVLLAGAIEAALGSHVQAQIHLAKVLERAPRNLYARKLLVASLVSSRQAYRALEVLQPALAQAPEDFALMTLAGEVYMQNNDFARASQYYERAARLDPKSAIARTGLGLSRLATGESERALADLESAVQLDSGKYQADILLIMSHLRRAKFDQALMAIGTLEKKQPNNPLTYNLKAAAYLGKKDTAAARRNLERALTLQPSYVPAATNLAQLDLQKKDRKAARRRFEAILEKEKDNVQALLALAALAPRLGATPKERIEWLERATKASPAAVQPKIMLARAYAQAGDPKKGLEIAQQAQLSSPDSAELLDVLGSLQMGSGATEQALATFGKLVKLQPKSPLALYRLASAQTVGGNRTEAAESLKKALSLKPDYVEAQVGLAELESRAGHYDAAIKIAQQLQKQADKSPIGFVLAGDVSMAHKKYTQAVKAYETAYGLGKNSRIAVKLHAAMTRAGKTGEADARLGQLLKESPDDAVVRLYWAEVNLKRGEFKNAVDQYEWMLRKQPDNLLALNNLAWAYQQLKDPRALQTAERAYKLKPDNAAIADTLGWMLVEQGNTARGIEILQKAVAAAPKAQEIRFHLAQGLIKAGDKAKAREELERIQANGTKFPQATEANALLKQLKN